MIARPLACIALASACSAPDEPAAWSTVFADLDRVPLSIWSDGPDEVYLAGGGLGTPGLPPLALHWDGAHWRDLAPPGDDTLWWVTGGSGERTDTWMVGEHGAIARWDGDAFTTLASPIDTTLFGAWLAAPDDVWIVGGRPGAGAVLENDVVLHWDGERLAREMIPTRGAALLKIWGSAPDDLWIAGEHGTLWHRTAGGWVDHATGSSTLFSVHGCARDDVYAVGGSQILHYDGTAWSQVGPPIYAAAIGVVCGPDGALITGSGGLKLRFERQTGAWFDDQLVAPWETDFHAAWIDAGGGEWAVGGNYNQSSDDGPRVGVVAYYGTQPPMSDGGDR
ncbi:MAG TPA: hypothetical protein VIU61_07990 [Kofleriaceae bacterium]